MLYIILFIIVIAIVVFIVKSLFKILASIIKFIGKALLAIIKFIVKVIYYFFYGPALGVGFLLNKLFAALHFQFIAGIGYFILLFIMQKKYADFSPDLVTWGYVKNSMLGVFLLVNFILHCIALSKQKLSVDIDYFKTEVNKYYRYLLASVLLFLQGFFFCYIFIGDGNDLSASVFYDVLYTLLSTAYLIYTLVKTGKRIKLINSVYGAIAFNTKLNVSELIGLTSDKIESDNEQLQFNDIQQVALGIGQKMIKDQEIIDISLSNNLWFIHKEYMDIMLSHLETVLSEETAVEQDRITDLIQKELSFSNEDSKDFSERYLDFGEYHYFGNKKKFVTYINQTRILVCTSCGNTKEISEEENTENEWYCSELCRETDTICLEIKNKLYDDFITDAATSGIIIMDAANKWNLNNRALVGSQPHGYSYAGRSAKRSISAGAKNYGSPN